MMKNITRRKLLKLSGATLAGAAAGTALTVTGCAPAANAPVVNTPVVQPAEAEKAAPTAVPPTADSSPTADISPTSTVPPIATVQAAPAQSKVYRRPEVIALHPKQKSRVVRATDANVWNGDTLSPEVLRKMMDNAITALTGIKTAKEAWQALFKPEETIAIKVNVFRNSRIWTHYPLVKVVTDSLQDAGVPGENIILYDYYTSELKEASYPVNPDGPGVRCYGTDSNYSTKWDIAGREFELTDILLKADALINMPVLKSHMISGVTFALKNHYGSVSYPDGLHTIEKYLPALNALSPIKDATRLVIGDVLEANTKYSGSYPYWSADARGQSILMSYDPLAHDTVGLQMLVKMAEEKGNSTIGIKNMSEKWFAAANQAGIGTSDVNNIELVEV